MTPLLLLLLLLFLLLTITTTTATNDEPSTMSAIAAALSPLPSDWTTTTDYCKWTGISCDGTLKVAAINLPSQSLTGSLPSSFSSLTHLTSLFLQNNHLSGPIPLFTNIPVLQNIYLDNNNFSSILPGTFSGLTSLQTLSLSENVNLQPWKFPPELSDSETLVSVFASNVNLVGTLPDIFGSLMSLQDLRLSYNNLTGVLPSSLNGSGIQTFWVNDQAQGLSGSIRVVSGMTQLTQVWLQGNKFTGAIPDLSSSEKMVELDLRDNQLTGVVPESLVDLPKLVNVSLQNNLLQGPMPVFPDTVIANLGASPRTNRFCRNDAGDCDPQVTTMLLIAKDLGYPVELADQWKGNNVCDGWIYVTCDNKEHVVSINFQKRGFVGTISPAFANLTNLRELYLNDNNLTGSIPNSLTKLDYLKKIDVSDNNLSGKVPVFRPGVSLLTEGNKNIGTEVPSPSSRPNSPHSSGGGSVSVGLVSGVVIAVVVFVIVVLFVSYKCYMKRRHKKSGKVHNPEVGQEMVNPTKTIKGTNGYNGVHGQFPMLEGGNVAIPIQLLKQVTNNFSEENILGHGGFGIVYKGELHDGTKIAVKRMESSPTGTKGMKEFEAEISVLTKVRHKHLVALLGYCINDNERLLVYEYMPQGTLSQHLFDWQECKYPALTWKERVTIALDVARGVEYLHSLARTSFIHRDLKPSNILLGDDMRAKVADFGLVKNAPDGKHSVETRLAGTFGYLAPEYAVTGRVTTKIDVYAFGVILMELITSRKALDETLPDETSHLVPWFRRIILNKDNLQKAIDTNLNPDDETLESISQVAELAGHCTVRDPQQRPDMGHAVNVLVPLVEKWKPSSSQTEEEEEDSYGGGIDLNISLPQALQRWQANEGTSTMMSEQSFSRTQTSIPAKPAGFTDTFDSSDCR